MKFLFWNVKKNPLGPIVSQIVREHNVEIIILAECSDPDAILVDLNSETEYLFHLTESQGTRVVIYTRFPAKYIETAHSDKFFTIRRIFCRRRERYSSRRCTLKASCTEVTAIGGVRPEMFQLRFVRSRVSVVYRERSWWAI